MSKNNNKENNEKLKYAEDWLPIKEIQGGLIRVEGKALEGGDQYVTGVRIEPRNIFISSQEEQDRTIYALRNFYNTLDYEFWLICCDRPVDINVYLSQLQLLFNQTQDQVKRKLIIEDINKANMFMNNNIVDTEYFLLFKEKNDDIINKRIRNLITSFANAGLNSHQVTNDDLRIILDNFLNGGQNTSFGTVIG